MLFANSSVLSFVTVSVNQWQNVSDFWMKLCGMKLFSKEDKKCVVGFSNDQCKLELQEIGTKVDHETAFGRIAFSCPRAEVGNVVSYLSNTYHKLTMVLFRE